MRLRKQHPGAFHKLQVLTKRGCEQDRLVFYLSNVKVYDDAGRLSKRQFQEMMTRSKQTLEDLVVLRNSILGLAASDTTASDLTVRTWDKLWQDLLDLLRDIASHQHLLGQKGNALLDDLKASIVRHVRQQTTKEHHEEVSALIDAALEKPYRPEAHKRAIAAHKMWVSRHARLLKQETHHEAKWRGLTTAKGSVKPGS